MKFQRKLKRDNIRPDVSCKNIYLQSYEITYLQLRSFIEILFTNLSLVTEKVIGKLTTRVKGGCMGLQIFRGNT